jgi:hypothetical protein
MCRKNKMKYQYKTQSEISLTPVSQMSISFRSSHKIEGTIFSYSQTIKFVKGSYADVM